MNTLTQNEGKHDAVFLKDNFIVVCYTWQSGNKFEVMKVYSFPRKKRQQRVTASFIVVCLRNVQTNVRY